MTDGLATALRDMADSLEPPHIDAALAICEGRRSRTRRRAAAGGAAVAVVAVALAVGSLSLLRPRSPSPVGAGPTPPVKGGGGIAPVWLDPADPLVTSWQFSYLPADMVSLGGAATPGQPYDNATYAYTRSGDGFAYDVTALPAAPTPPSAVAGAQRIKIAAVVQGARQAYWDGYGAVFSLAYNPDAALIDRTHDSAQLYWQSSDGTWLSLVPRNIGTRSGWRAEALRVAAGVVRGGRSVPMPLRLTGPMPVGLKPTNAYLSVDWGVTNTELVYDDSVSQVFVVGVEAGQSATSLHRVQPGDFLPAQAVRTCDDLNGLTVCVAVLGSEPAWVTAAGGRIGLLGDIVSLGSDPAAWTTDVLP